ncbi:MAG: glycosyltransferase family 4 protein [Candidatus Latescibacteria bacterium]|nr:glycosyltransferase family 4 protein [Candidatus Latescibacterota bacterium]
MKIGMIHTLYGRRAGLELYVEKILYGMTEKYVNLEFVVFCNAELNEILEPHGRIKKIYIPFLDNQIKKALWIEFIAQRTVDKESIDVFWIPSGTNAFPGRWKAKTVVTFHDFGEYHLKGKYSFARMVFRKRLAIPLSIKRGCLLTAVSQTTARDLSNYFPKAPKARVIYSGPNPRKKEGNIGNPTEEIKKETGAVLKEILFTPGRTDFIGKGLDLLLIAYKEMRRDFPDVPPLVLVGPKGEGHEKLIMEIDRQGLAGSVMWLGRVSDACVDALYSISEMVVIPSRYEGFGFPLLEAMEHRKPLVCSNAGAMEEVAGNACYLFESGNAHALLEAMMKVYHDKGFADRIVSRASERLALFDWNKTFESMKAVFCEAAAE